VVEYYFLKKDSVLWSYLEPVAAVAGKCTEHIDEPKPNKTMLLVLMERDLTYIATAVLLPYVLQVLMMLHSLHENRLVFRELRKCS
jgi:hypothetical protein